VSFLPQREVFREFIEAAATACSRDVVHWQDAFNAGIYETLETYICIVKGEVFLCILLVQYLALF